MAATRVVYDPWGLPQGAGNYATGIWTASTSLISSTLAGQIASEQVLRYASYVYDPESSLYYCSARYYDPATRQFTTSDSAKADGEESAYQYCGGKPIGEVDSTGEEPYSLEEFCWSSPSFAIADYFCRIGSLDSAWNCFLGAMGVVCDNYTDTFFSHSPSFWWVKSEYKREWAKYCWREWHGADVKTWYWQYCAYDCWRAKGSIRSRIMSRCNGEATYYAIDSYA